MRIDIDRYREILDTLSRNKSRTLLTGFGVFWGVFMLVGLMGGGQGLKELLSSNFDGFATNSAIIWEQPTTKPYAGFRKGRNWCMNYRDVERLKDQVPELDVVTPMVSRWGNTAVHGDKKFNCSLKGLMPYYATVCAARCVSSANMSIKTSSPRVAILMESASVSARVTTVWWESITMMEA